jgi:hypothetical protein
VRRGALIGAAAAAVAVCLAGMLWLRRTRLQKLPEDLAFLAQHERHWAPSSPGRVVKIIIGVFLAGLLLNAANWTHFGAADWYEAVLLMGTLIAMMLWIS